MKSCIYFDISDSYPKECQILNFAEFTFTITKSFEVKTVYCRQDDQGT